MTAHPPQPDNLRRKGALVMAIAVGIILTGVLLSGAMIQAAFPKWATVVEKLKRK